MHEYAIQDAPTFPISFERPFYNHLMTIASLALIAFSACKGRATDASGTSAWTPNHSDTVMGVPPANVVSSTKTTLATRPPTMSASRWKYVQRLYLAYDDVPLWLEADGF